MHYRHPRESGVQGTDETLALDNPLSRSTGWFMASLSNAIIAEPQREHREMSDSGVRERCRG